MSNVRTSWYVWMTSTLQSLKGLKRNIVKSDSGIRSGDSTQDYQRMFMCAKIPRTCNQKMFLMREDDFKDEWKMCEQIVSGGCAVAEIGATPDFIANCHANASRTSKKLRISSSSLHHVQLSRLRNRSLQQQTTDVLFAFTSTVQTQMTRTKTVAAYENIFISKSILQKRWGTDL